MRNLVICAALVAPVLLGSTPGANVTMALQAGATPAATKPDTAKVDALAKQIDAESRNGTLKILQQTVDDAVVIERALANINVPADLRQGMLKASIGQRVTGELTQKMAKGATYRFLRVRDVQGQIRALFRYAGDDGLNYHEHVFENGPRGLRIVDIHIMSTGEPMSLTMRRMTLQAVFQMTKKGNGADQDLDRVLEFIKQIRTGNGKEALKLYEAFSPTQKKDPAIMVMRVMAAGSSGDDAAHLRAIEEFQKAHPDSAAVAILSIDAFILREKWNEAGKAVDHLDKLVGGDPYLDVLRANIAVGQNQSGKAKTLLDSAMKREPSMADAYYTAIDLALAAKEFDRVATLLSAATKDAGVTWPDLTGQEPFAEFVKSPAYQRWVKGSK